MRAFAAIRADLLARARSLGVDEEALWDLTDTEVARLDGG
jgi:hypothetical protein